MNKKKTRLMLTAEAKAFAITGKATLELSLPDLYNRYGLPETAERLQVSKATLWYWFLKFGITVDRRAVPPGQELVTIRRKEGGPDDAPQT